MTKRDSNKYERTIGSVIWWWTKFGIVYWITCIIVKLLAIKLDMQFLNELKIYRLIALIAMGGIYWVYTEIKLRRIEKEIEAIKKKKMSEEKQS